ncbi:MAG: hypothetical protein JXA09_17950, partial [Anaerolineae bacterium]|nr:hypothetical protein [Anaerolineae bacterium]
VRALGVDCDPTRETVVLHDDRDGSPYALPNPLRSVEEVLGATRHLKANAIHGDLNLENVLVDPQVRDVRLIDFAEARQDHVLHDFLRLEAEVVTKVLPAVLASAGLPAATVRPFYEQLHCATFQFDQDSASRLRSSALERPFAILSAIREAARHGFYDRDDATEYYQGLTIYLLGTLKYDNLDRIRDAKRIAFLCAATVQPLLRGESPCAKYLPDYRARAPCPYRGLSAFEEEHAALFFGREDLTQHVLEVLRGALAAGGGHRMLAIVGPSGSGKSSLLRAGVLAALRRGALPGSQAWQLVICRPGAAPLQSLAAALYRAKLIDLPEADDLCTSARDSARALYRVAYHESSEPRLVLLVDQFEEVFAACSHEEARRAFIDNLLYAAGASGGNVVVLLALRADFYGHCAAYELADVLPTHHVLVPPMDEGALRRAIQQPAYLAGRVFEAGMVARLLDDVRGQAGGLPLMQHALVELWERGTGQTLTHAAYEAIGRVDGALERRAEAAYTALSPPDRALCRHLFLQLVQPGEGTVDTARRARASELLPAGGDAAALEMVLQRLAEARLVTTGLEEGERFVEVAHEALIQSWQRLHAWVDESRDDLRTHRRLSEAAHEWAVNARDPSFLYWGTRLALLERWAEAHAGEMSTLQRAFLDACLVERQRRQLQARERSRRLAQDASQALARDPGLALLLAVEASRAGDAPEAEQALRACLRYRTARSALVGHRGSLRHLALDPVGTLAATAGADGTARIWDLEREEARAVLTLHAQGVRRLAWDSAGARLATAGDDGTVQVWDAASGEQVAVSARHAAKIYHVAWSPDGEAIISAGGDGSARVWDVRTGVQRMALDHAHAQAPPREPGRRSSGTDRIVYAAWDSGQTRILTVGGDGTARVWDARLAIQLLVLPHRVTQASRVYRATWSPDGARIVTVQSDCTARVTDAQYGIELAVLSGHSRLLSFTAWSPDGTRIVTAGQDATARVWDARSGDELAVFDGHARKVNRAAWDATGTWIVTSSDDGTARVWDAASGAELAVLCGHDGMVRFPRWNGAGTRIVAAGSGETAYVWDLDDLVPASAARVAPDDMLAAAARLARRNMSALEWRTYMGHDAYRETFPGKPVPAEGTDRA